MAKRKKTEFETMYSNVTCPLCKTDAEGIIVDGEKLICGYCNFELKITFCFRCHYPMLITSDKDENIERLCEDCDTFDELDIID